MVFGFKTPAPMPADALGFALPTSDMIASTLEETVFVGSEATRLSVLPVLPLVLVPAFSYAARMVAPIEPTPFAAITSRDAFAIARIDSVLAPCRPTVLEVEPVVVLPIELREVEKCSI